VHEIIDVLIQFLLELIRLLRNLVYILSYFFNLRLKNGLKNGKSQLNKFKNFIVICMKLMQLPEIRMYLFLFKFLISFSYLFSSNALKLLLELLGTYTKETASKARTDAFKYNSNLIFLLKSFILFLLK